MGIKDLLKFMKPYIVPIHINKYSGKRVGVDAFSWLHKGAYSCSMELALNTKGEKGRRYLQYCMHHINLLRHNGITPVVVFDGGSIPCKSNTASERRRRRNANHALAKEKLDQGNVNAAIELFQKAVHITPEMAHQLIQILKTENIEFVVAPYEADSQLAYLSTLEPDQGGISAVITEDSDLMAYGCQAIIFKMDRYGNAQEILMDNVFNSLSDGPSFKHFDIELFTGRFDRARGISTEKPIARVLNPGMCVMAGCDFLPSIPDIGIKRAHSLVSKYRNLDSVLSILKIRKEKQMPDDYVKSFKKAIAVFRHALIYDPGKKTLKNMKPLPDSILQSLDGDLDILGPDLPTSIAISIAEGCMNPITKEVFDSKAHDQLHTSITVRKASTIHIRRQQDSQTPYRNEIGTSIFSIGEMSEEKIKAEPEALEKYSNESIALRKLLLPMKSYKAEKKAEDKVLDFPDNNPFKKRKLVNSDAETAVVVARTVTEQTISEVTNVESGKSKKKESVDSLPLLFTEKNLKASIETKSKMGGSKSKSKSKVMTTKKGSITSFFMRKTAS